MSFYPLAVKPSPRSPSVISSSTWYWKSAHPLKGVHVRGRRSLCTATSEAERDVSPSQSEVEAMTGLIPANGNSDEVNPTSVTVIGAGSVGTTTANALIRDGHVSDVYLLDTDHDRCVGEVLDLSDAGFLDKCRVHLGTYEAARSSDVVIITAGAKQRPGEARTSLIDRNAEIMRSIFSELEPIAPHTLFLVVANPVDVLSSIAQKVSGLPPHRVIGSGTMLDSMRLRGEVGTLLGLDSNSVHLYVVGEHGDSQVAAWSSGYAGGCPLATFTELTPEVRAQLADFSMNKAYEIIKRKGATYFGVAHCVSRIVEAIMQDNNTILPLSMMSEHGIYISQPVRVCRKGAFPLTDSFTRALDEAERAAVEESVAAMKGVLREAGFQPSTQPSVMNA